MQLDLESGAWLTFKKKKKKCFQKATLIRGGGVGNSGHCSALWANPAQGDVFRATAGPQGGEGHRRAAGRSSAVGMAPRCLQLLP